MSVPVLTFFNSMAGVGTTSLVYHLSHMMTELGKRVLAVDLDPQANLTSAFLDADALEALWDQKEASTIYRAIEPLIEVGDILPIESKEISPNLHLVPGDVALSGFEETLSAAWPDSMGDTNLYRPFRILSAFWQVSQAAAKQQDADLILVDLGPNLGAINRSALIASDFVVIPLGADLFSLQGLKNLGPTMRTWRSSWGNRVLKWSNPSFDLPQGRMEPLGYVVEQHGVRLNRPGQAYDRWINRVPCVYEQSVLQQAGEAQPPGKDPNCLATVKPYRSLVPMAQEWRKPIFALTPADGAIGSHAQAVQGAYKDFDLLARKILDKMARADAPRAISQPDSPPSKT